mmetsp:Transcript_125422/g.401670  ORF Transcript_125422/g.401670 Transcript_125422/m.401670 type:complete len:354 (-) Transcript_125422:430-1491(-)
MARGSCGSRVSGLRRASAASNGNDQVGKASTSDGSWTRKQAVVFSQAKLLTSHGLVVKGTFIELEDRTRDTPVRKRSTSLPVGQRFAFSIHDAGSVLSVDNGCMLEIECASTIFVRRLPSMATSSTLPTLATLPSLANLPSMAPTLANLPSLAEHLRRPGHFGHVPGSASTSDSEGSAPKASLARSLADHESMHAPQEDDEEDALSESFELATVDSCAANYNSPTSPGRKGEDVILDGLWGDCFEIGVEGPHAVICAALLQELSFLRIKGFTQGGARRTAQQQQSHSRGCVCILVAGLPLVPRSRWVQPLTRLCAAALHSAGLNTTVRRGCLFVLCPQSGETVLIGFTAWHGS